MLLIFILKQILQFIIIMTSKIRTQMIIILTTIHDFFRLQISFIQIFCYINIIIIDTFEPISTCSYLMISGLNDNDRSTSTQREYRTMISISYCYLKMRITFYLIPNIIR